MTTSRIVLAAVSAGALLPAAAAHAGGSAVPCRTVTVAETHGTIARGARLAAVTDGRVLAFNGNTGARARVRFRADRLRWLRSASGGRYVLAGQNVTRAGRPGGVWVVAAALSTDGSTACAGASGPRAFAADAASSTTTDTPLIFGGVEEVSASTTNRIQPLRNVTTQRVCTNMQTHPDGAPRDTVNPNPRPGVWCYKGPGAWLNDANGMERDSTGAYWGANCLSAACEDVTKYRHVVLYNGALVMAAKRPAALGDGTALPNTAIAWRIYSANFHNPAGL